MLVLGIIVFIWLGYMFLKALDEQALENRYNNPEQPEKINHSYPCNEMPDYKRNRSAETTSSIKVVQDGIKDSHIFANPN